ncbi:hypothetical protein V1520DRAFT_330556 [Lipomyces starkeyi]|uniref:Uncharacterized protein n=1 Tax=Lipomyces starkeyi NRRL Y-11557 TaxID=675824 RepID=A0A1E3Q9F4_LIPST|nr:hypothetical protein LIPSTDRAFT_62240 [Lipomyces starkeyi NRRL Y-11557]
MAQSLSKRVNLPPSEVPCKFFRSGVCRRGNSCWFKHESCKTLLVHPLRGASASAISLVTKPAEVDEYVESSERNEVHTQAENSSKAGTTTTSIVSDARYKESPEDDEDVDKCAICLEVPNIFGLLLNCDHVFCLSCMREWRITSGMATREFLGTVSEDSTADTYTERRGGDITLADHSLRAERRRTEVRLNKCCPLCRRPSDFIVPSSHRPAKSTAGNSNRMSGEHAKQLTKQEIIDAYLATLKHIPCKYFAATRSCQFGNDCHYAHRVPAQKVRGMTANGRSSTCPESPRRQGTTDPYREYVFSPLELLQCASRFRRQRQLEYSRIDRDEVDQLADELLFYDRLDIQDDLPYEAIPSVFDVIPRDSVEPDPVMIISEHISRLRALILERHGN